jgi:hypothetical protein
VVESTLRINTPNTLVYTLRWLNIIFKDNFLLCIIFLGGSIYFLTQGAKRIGHTLAANSDNDSVSSNGFSMNVESYSVMHIRTVTILFQQQFSYVSQVRW